MTPDSPAVNQLEWRESETTASLLVRRKVLVRNNDPNNLVALSTAF